MAFMTKGRKILDNLVDKNRYYSVFMSLKERTASGYMKPHGKPGEAIMKLTPEEREALSELKSDEIANINPRLF